LRVTPRAFASATSTPELGMLSPRSYFPIAWAVTISPIAADRPRRERPALRRASLILSEIMAALLPVYTCDISVCIVNCTQESIKFIFREFRFGEECQYVGPTGGRSPALSPAGRGVRAGLEFDQAG